MSEGVAQNIGDDQAVVGEPASHPHQAVVVGEPPEEMAPVLGEPVPLANGLGDRQPISPRSADETSVNGVQTEDSSFSESRIGEAAVEVGAHRSDLPVAENSHPSEPGVQEISSASDVEATDAADVPATEATDAADVAAETDPDRHDSNSSVEEEPAADVEVTHIVETPSEVLPPVPTENPFLALDEGSAADDEKESLEDPLVLDQSLPATLVSGEAPDTNVPPAQDETLSKGLGASDTAQQEETTIPLSHSQEGLSSEHPASTQTPVDDKPSEGAEVSEPVREEVHSVEPELASHEDVPAQDCDAIKAIPADIETGCTEVEHSLAAQPNQVSETDASVQENDTRGEIPVGSETATSGIKQVLSRETPLSEFLTKESYTPRDDVLQENHPTSDASQVLNDPKTPAETPLDLPVVPEDTRAISSDEYLVDQAPTEEASLPPAANGDNGFHHGEDCNLEREQDLSKDEDESAEVKEKPSSRMKLPYIVTGLAIAAVSVALVSISRPH